MESEKGKKRKNTLCVHYRFSLNPIFVGNNIWELIIVITLNEIIAL